MTRSQLAVCSFEVIVIFIEINEEIQCVFVADCCQLMAHCGTSCDFHEQI